MTQLSPYLQLTTLAYLAGKHTGDTFHVYIYDNDGKRFSLTRNGHFIARGVPLQEAKDLLLLFIPDELKGQTTKNPRKTENKSKHNQMSSIYPPKSTLEDIHERFQTADHTESDFEDLLNLAKTLMQDLEDEKARNFNLEMDSFFARGGQIPNQ